jgi:hypothetical protein
MEISVSTKHAAGLVFFRLWEQGETARLDRGGERDFYVRPGVRREKIQGPSLLGSYRHLQQRS